MTTRQRWTIWVVTLAAVALAGVFAWRSVPRFPRLELRAPVLELPDPQAAYSPTTGGRPLLLVVIENAVPARPQAGLADACLVYALPTEARITRFMAAYCQQTPDVIGPVRSVRKHMLDIASDLGAILVHAGYSEEARLQIARHRLPVLNEFARPAPFWRDKARLMPHNLYTGYAQLLTELTTRPIPSAPQSLPFTFAYEGPADSQGTAAPVVSLDYGPRYAVTYHYDPATRRYLRRQDDRPHLDADGRQISPASVVVLFVRWRDVLVNRAPSSQIDLAGDGRLAVITRGRLGEGRWSRPEGGPLVMADRDGRPIALPPGPVWIELFPIDRPFEIRAETVRQ